MRDFAESIKQLPIGQLKPYPGNPRINKKAIDKVAASLREFGWKQPIVVDKDLVIIAGHTRLAAAKKNGDRVVPVLIADDLTPEQVQAYRLADNKTAEFAEWNIDLLNKELDALKGVLDMEPFGFDPVIPLEALEDDFDPDAEVEAVAKQGEVWVLGRHRLMCGDSTKMVDVMRLMGGQQADLVLTDPPYNVDYEGGSGLKIQNDNLNDDQFLQFLTASFDCMNKTSKAGAAVYIFHADSEGYNFRVAFKRARYEMKQCLVWVKSSLVMGRQDYQWKHEPILYGWKAGAAHAWYSDRKQTTVLEWDKPSKNGEHPTMKPVGLVGYLIENSSKQGDLVQDLFGGSGTTLVAAEQLNRACFMMELDPHYCDVIINRWEALTGGKARKEAK